MPKESRKWVVTIFIVVTAILVGTMLYSFYEYLGIFTAVRSLRLSIGDLDFTVVDPTRAVVATTLYLNNTSSKEFLAYGIDQKVWVNGVNYVGSSSMEGVSSSYPFRVFPRSSNNLTLTLDINLDVMAIAHPELVEMLLDPDQPKTWQVYAFVFMDVPLLGKFSMFDYRTIAPL